MYVRGRVVKANTVIFRYDDVAPAGLLYDRIGVVKVNTTMLTYRGMIPICVVHSCLLVGCLMSQQRACVSQRRICSDKFTCCHTEIKISTSPSYSVLTTGQLVPALNLFHQAPVRVATGVSFFKSGV